ncbi:hypothetical protein EYC80_005993 [Monilinia laxa]|uniref:Uncharacterized protein n=1 Tax=Monilinia laxa TaxID=61186 RepID=A0A5N6KFT1_MONLA|nr:hypothetical protein EYC80_005993 [Monilinia laxa]
MYERVVRLAVYSILILCCTVSIYLHYTPYKLYNTYHNYYTILLIQTLSKMHDLFSFTSLQEFKAPQPPPSIHPFPHSSIPSFKFLSPPFKNPTHFFIYLSSIPSTKTQHAS